MEFESTHSTTNKFTAQSPSVSQAGIVSAAGCPQKKMSSQRVLSARATRILACAGLLSYDELSSTDDNAVIVDILRNSKRPHLLGDLNSPEVLAEVNRWLTTSQNLSAEDLPTIESALFMRSYLVGYTFTVADAAVYEAIRGKCTASVRNFRELSRWYNHMQSICPLDGFDTLKFGSEESHFICLPSGQKKTPLAQKAASLPNNDVKIIAIDEPKVVATDKTVDVPAAAVAIKKEKKEKKKDTVSESKAPSDAVAVAEGVDELDPSKLDIRVGVVVKCWNHPDSDKCKCPTSCRINLMFHE